MRTKFITPNYFTTTSQSLHFLRLPLSPPPLSTATVYDNVIDDLLRSTAASVVSFDLPHLPFDDALSNFYSGVIPRTIDVDFGEFEVDHGDVVQVQEAGADLCYTGKHFESLDNRFSEETKEDTGGDTVQNGPVVVQFEIPELSQYAESACMSEKENFLFLSEVQTHDDNLEMLNLVHADQLNFVSNDLVNSIEPISLEYDMSQLQIPEDADLLPNISHPRDTVFPLLEVDETEPAEFMWFVAENDWQSLLFTMREHHSVGYDDLDLSCQNLFISVNIDILELVSDYHTSKLPSDFSLTILDLTVNAGFLQLIEAPINENHIGMQDPKPVPFLPILQFEEFEMPDFDSFDIFEALAISQTAKELDTCDQLFHTNQHFKSFDELIVSSELAIIIDGTFTSLPVPVLVDDEKMWSVEFIVDVVLAELEQLPFSTSDEIYLDWHLLGTDKSSSHVDAAIEKVFNDVEDYKINTNLESSDCGMLVLDFLLSEYPSDKLDAIEDKVYMLSGGSCTEEQRVNVTATKRLLDDDCQFMGSKVKILKPGIVKVACSSLSDDDDCQIIENPQLLRDGDFGGVASSFESMTQVNDLDFFLNPTKVAVDMRTDERLKQPFDKFILSGGPLSESFNIVSAEAPIRGSCDSLAVPVCQTALESESVEPCDPSFPDMIIVVNTENFEKEMIISRRGTYQKILSMEKRGVQVVERDLMLPIDIILDAVTCIVWYDCKNIGKKSTAQDEGSSSVPLCIENIAANVLTSLSFMFTSCILVFEGDSNFLGTVMESADEVYAAAASLGTNIQIFCSYSFELTEEIILNYIGQARKFCKGSLPRLPETETRAESFLTKIPSINPLSAHAITSCGCMLLKYFEWSGDCRIRALRKYNLPEESVNLLNILFKCGEREETKSGLTDCSSSVSSPPDSGKIVHKVNSVDRKRKFNANASDAMHDFKRPTASDKYIVDEMNYMESLPGSRASKSPRVSLLKKSPDFFLDAQLFGDKAIPGSAANMESFKERPASTVPGTRKVPQLRDDFAEFTFPINDGFGEQKSGWADDIKREGCATDLPQDLQEDFVGEVFNSYDKSPFGMDFQVAERTVKSSPNDGVAVDDYAPRSSKVGRKLSFDSSSYLNFPLDDFDTNCVLEDSRQLRADNDYNGVDCNWGSNGFIPQQEPMGTGLFEKSMKNFMSPLSRDKFVPLRGETPLSRAVHSAQLQQGSPWTIEFLNRIKEKRRMRQQNQPGDTSVPQSSNLRNITSVPQSSNLGNITSVPQSSSHGKFSKETKRRSPSILEYYKYQGGSRGGTPKKLTPQKLQKQQGQNSNEKPSGFRPSWTPIDKRARRSLTFATGGAGGQTKLIWNDNISCNQGSRLSK
ncbi:hypothetical protein vseg_014668 [Gypsophila vaccaria]